MLTGSLSRAGGGVFEIVRALSGALADGQVEVEAFGLQDEHTAADASRWAPVRTHACAVRGPRALGYAPQLPGSLARYAPDVVHQHGLWIHPSYVGHRWKRKGGRAHVITPQGMLEPWVMRHHGRRKQAVWRLFEREHLRGADCINVNSTAELAHLRDLGIDAPACIVANGVDLPGPLAEATAAPWHDRWPSGTPVLLYLGRLHAKKGLAELVEGWALARGQRGSDWRLAILGWDQAGYAAQLGQLIARWGLDDEVHWFGPAFGATKAAALQQAQAFALPSFSEGLPIAVLEAWAHHLPVIMTRACNLDCGFESGAALEVRPEPASIAEGLQRLWSLSGEAREAMGRNGRALVDERFTWPRIAGEMRAVYAWCLGQGGRPDCVHLGS